MCPGIPAPGRGELGDPGVSFEITGLRDSRDPPIERVEEAVKAEGNAVDPIIRT
jgi:hypothetical protein